MVHGRTTRRALGALLMIGMTSAVVPVAIAEPASATTTNVVTVADIAPGGTWASPPGAATGSFAFTEDIAGPPLGNGSVIVELSSSSQHRQFFDYAYGRCSTGLVCNSTATPLANIDTIGYSTYRVSAGGGNWSYGIEADPDTTANGGANVDYVSFVFDPSGTVSGTWQTWDALSPADGVWYATRDLDGLGGGLFDCGPFSCGASFAQIQAAFPNAAVILGMGLNAGSGANGFVGAADAVTVGVSGSTTVSDFELAPLTTETVDAADYRPDGPWFSVEQTGGRNFVAGPGTPPIGDGSLQMTVSSSSQHVQFYNYSYGACATGTCGDVPGTLLTSFTELGFSTYRQSGSAGAGVPNLSVEVDPNVAANGGANLDFTTLVFVPNNAAIVNGTWQQWNTFSPSDGVWYSSRNLGTLGGGIYNCGPFSCSHSWSEITTALPDAMLVAGLGFNLGSGISSFNGNVDDLRIGILGTDKVYDFEAPTLALSPATASIVEGNSGTKTLTATVTLTGKSFTNITVPYQTVAGTATVTTDFVAAAGTLTFTPGQTTKTITLKVKGDTVVEPDETFSLELGAPSSNAVLANDTETVTIVHDDKPAFSITVGYGNEGTSRAVTVKLSVPAPAPTTFTFQSASVTAIEGVDFGSIDGQTITFNTGEGGTKTLSVPLFTDGTTEAAEKYTVTASSSGVKVSPKTANGFIRSNNT